MSAPLEAQLRERLAEVSRRIVALEAELQHEMDDDFAEQAVDRADDEPLEGIERTLRQEAEDLDRTLVRLKSGEYGRCTACGEPIAAARLAALPTASLCIACASRSE